MNYEDLTEEVEAAMTALAAHHADFGRDNRGESRFQDALAAELRTRNGWNVERERPFRSSRFLNNHFIQPDLLVDTGGQVYAIELKYVYRKERNGVLVRPDNTPGFLYDVIKDCAKIETIIGKTSYDSTITAPVAGGLSIGLTDFDYWARQNEQNWARNFVLPEERKWTSPPEAPFFAPVAGANAQCIHPIVFHHKRYHVALSDGWQYRWHDFHEQFRFVVLRHAEPDADAPRATGEQESPLLRHGTVPFRDAAHREAAMAVKHRFDADYVANDRTCPVCSGQWAL
ncbi:MAG: hypothetical protein KGM18_00800 [Sphingomonadales bacterium]|nr:hypothetical protein [Sphingomonadales bacterium]